MSKSLFRDKYVRKFQQGGGTITPLNPNVFRTPMRTTDASMFAKTISPGVDVNILINENIRRENAALQREKLQQQKDLLDRKQAMELEKEIFKSYMNEISTIGSPINSKGQPVIPNNDPRNSKRFRDQFNQQKQTEIQATEELLKIVNSPHSDQKNGLMLKQLEKLRQVKQQGPNLTDLDVDRVLYDKINSVAFNSDPKNKLKVNMPVYNDWLTRRNNYYDMADGSDTPGYYTLGVEPPNLYYNEDVARKKFDDIYKNVNTRVPVGKSVKEENGIIKQVEDYTVLDTEAAADILTDSVITDPDILAYIQDKYDIKLNPGDQSPQQRTAIRNILLPMLKADDVYTTKVTTQEETYKGRIPAQRTPAGGGRVSSGGGSRSRGGGGATTSVNQTAVDRFRNKHFNTTTKTFDGASAASDPQLSAVAGAIVDNMYPDLSKSSAAGIAQRAALMKSITSSFLSYGGDPNNTYFLNKLREKLNQVLTEDLDYIQPDKLIKELKEDILLQRQNIRDQEATSQLKKPKTQNTSGSGQKTRGVTGPSGTTWF